MSFLRLSYCLLIEIAFELTRFAFCVVVSEDLVETYKRERTLGDRGLIVENLASYQEERDRLSKSIPCIESLVKKYIDEPGRSVLLELDNETDVNEMIARPLVTSLKARFAFFTHTTDMKFDIPAETASSTIILMSSSNSLEDSLNIVYPCDRGCLFVAILTSEFQEEKSFLEDARLLIESMWSTRRLAIVVAVARVGNSVLVAGSVTFEPYKPCSPSPPIVLDKCNDRRRDADDRDATLNRLKKLGPPALNNCLLKVAYFDQPPYVMSVNGTANLTGFEGSLAEEVTRGMQIEWERVEWSENTSYSEQVQMLLYDETMADLVIGRILQQSHRDIGYSTTYDMLKVVWLVPKVPKVSLEGLVLPFQPYVWAAIGGSLLFGGLIKFFLIRDVSWLDIFGLIIGASLARQPTKLSRKIHFVSWSIFGLFLSQIYVDSLAGQLIDESILKIETMKDLISSSFEIGGTAAFARLFDEFEHTDEIVRQVRDKMVVFEQDQYLDQFGDLLEGRNTTFALVAVLNSSRSDAIETAYAYTITTEVICSFPLGFATWTGFPYLRFIDDKIHDFIDHGIFDFMIRQALANDTRLRKFAMANDQEYKSELHLPQFVPAFLLMLIGFSSGLTFLFIEIALYPWKLLE
ncbi:uncharacterized protein LOC128896394 [Hylaeus anthracinus]|uniref:uncharacterized protein LOC128896394 n=1 Tax=Hylaeus anthracinus TaxID=313031 RepID=UPI0023B8DD80|nr:uncharacterized protein LOC128896394 [Hylaeus anthracinus]